MPESLELLELSKSIALRAGQRLLDADRPDYNEYVHCQDNPREVKALADTVMEKDILDALIPTGLPILSEESGYISGQPGAEYIFIVDPLDGTFNFVKGLGPSAVSIALWKNQRPVFGVIYSLLDRKLAWGGAGMGSYCDDQRLSVSSTSIIAKASICTGFPARLDVQNEIAMQNFLSIVKPFAKVRMLGSAAVSLLNVARGSADAYSEQDIMLWDVAAGIAIVEGAGGSTHFVGASTEHALNVYASNGILPVSN